MFKNYFKVALRSLLKNKSYVLINTFGLGIALACCLTAYLLLAYNIEFDQTFTGEKLDRTFRIHTHYVNPEGENRQHINSPLNLGPAISQEIPGVEAWTRFQFDGGFVRFGDKSFSEGIAFADEDFYEMFDYELLKGDFSSFHKLNHIVISERTAEKYFPDENPIGQVLTLNFANNHEVKAVVGAVFKNVPLNSSLVFDLMMRTEHFQDTYNLSNTEWGDWRDPALFLRLTNPESSANVPDLLTKYVDLRNEYREDVNVVSYQLHPFHSNVNQDDVDWSQINIRISIVPLIVFAVMALMILLIACFNLTNTTVAITAKRFKEVGIRKVAGASRQHIVGQFLFEMIVTILLALVAGLVMSRIIVPEFADMWGLTYGLGDLNGVNFVITLLILVFASSVLAGLYPALSNSKHRPVQLLKGGTKQKSVNLFTKILVASQFAISVIVLVNGIVFTQNTKYQEAIDYGFNMKNVLTVGIQSHDEYVILKSRATQNPMIEQLGITHHQLGLSSYPFPLKIDTTEYQAQHIEIGENFFETMGLQLVEGRFLNVKFASDQKSIVVNEKFLEDAGIENALATTVEIREEDYRIVGVVADHVDNLFRSKEAEPFVFYPSKPHEYQMMLIKTSKEDLIAVQDYMEEVWEEEFPDKPITIRSQEDLTLGGLRQTNANLKQIFIFLTILGGLLSASGIFALASLSVRKRTKEIGIRKALGATVHQVVGLLSRSFTILLIIASVVGAAAGYLLSDLLLGEIYARHISVGALPLLLAILIIGGIGIFTTMSIIYRAAIENPVLALRDE